MDASRNDPGIAEPELFKSFGSLVVMVSFSLLPNDRLWNSRRRYAMKQHAV